MHDVFVVIVTVFTMAVYFAVPATIIALIGRCVWLLTARFRAQLTQKNIRRVMIAIAAGGIVLLATRSVNAARIAIVVTEAAQLEEVRSAVLNLFPEPGEGDDPSAHKLRDTSIILTCAVAGGLLVHLAIGLGHLWTWGALFGGLCGVYHVTVIIPGKRG